MLGGTNVAVTGPSFREGDNIECSFDGIRVAGSVVNKNSAALCVSPQLMKTGYLTVEFYKNGQRYNTTANFYSSKSHTLVIIHTYIL